LQVAVIVNPAAGGGRMGRIWPAAEAVLSRRFASIAVAITQGPGDGRRLAAEFTRQGMELIVAAGGDGTASEVADGMLTAAAGARAPDLALLPVGTGSDLARSLGIGRDFAVLADAIAAGPTRELDAAQVSYRLEDGTEQRRHVLNIASLGISADIARAVNASPKRLLTGKGLFAWHTLRELARYRGVELSVRVDGAAVFSGPSALVAVANNHSFAGGMMIAPDARMDDGLLDVVVVRDAPRLTLIRALRLVYDGSHRRLDLCSFHRGSTVEIAASSRKAGLEIDGETAGFTPVSVRVLPRALRLRG
jgi:diacylglycerol kinase (ATP)